MLADILAFFVLMAVALCTCGALVLAMPGRDRVVDTPESRRVGVERQPRRLLPLSLEEQWGRITDLVARYIGAAERARGLQAAAEEQIDAAQYALKRLAGELSRVMQVSREAPAPAAVVHRLKPPARARAARKKSALAA